MFMGAPPPEPGGGFAAGMEMGALTPDPRRLCRKNEAGGLRLCPRPRPPGVWRRRTKLRTSGEAAGGLGGGAPSFILAAKPPGLWGRSPRQS
ncbi:MAG: hypothetical protein GY696_40755 [Gammaproteobacteria bacterium]|nr:hypothetical protein [Gammaproteobacteria bacterium]